jgi:tRNA pseudouridine55 synthase
MNGVLVVDKPSGPTSHDVVAVVRRALGTKRVGHTGTLDPMATGVLALVIGQATRLAQFLSPADKEYVADVRFGLSTPTYDAMSAPTDDPGGPVDLSRLDDALTSFRGTYLQMPPPYSAKKLAGKAAYEVARAGGTPELTPVEVSVNALEVVERDERSVRLRLVCSSGFYVRSLAHDLGGRLGCGAHLTALRRTRAGEFTLDRAITLADLDAEGPAAAQRLVPLEALLPALPAARLSPEGTRKAGHGARLGPADVASDSGPEEAPVRLLDAAGHLLGIAQREPGGVLHPVVVLV